MLRTGATAGCAHGWARKGSYLVDALDLVAGEVARQRRLAAHLRIRLNRRHGDYRALWSVLWCEKLRDTRKRAPRRGRCSESRQPEDAQFRGKESRGS